MLLTNKNFDTILMPISSRYIGNIPTNIPMPFNIPLQVVRMPISKSQQIDTTDNNEEKIPSPTRIALNYTTKSNDMTTDNNTASRIHRVLLKLTYIDDLKNSREIIVNGPLKIRPTQIEESSNQGNNPSAFLVVAVIIAIGITSVITIRWTGSERNMNLVSKTYNISSRMEVTDSTHQSGEKKEGAPFSQM